jgi:hypothetical protein
MSQPPSQKTNSEVYRRVRKKRPRKETESVKRVGRRRRKREENRREGEERG